MKVAIVAGEASGDILGAGLIRELRKQQPDIEILAVSGPEMDQQGCRKLESVDALAVFGLFEVLKHLPRLLRLRKRLVKEFLAFQPDVFIGIDAPDFNLGLERRLRDQGIKTVHYVSPSVWAWRQKRVFKIKKCVDLMLTLFPFEVDFYTQHDVPAKCVGHTLADDIPEKVDAKTARLELGLAVDKQTVAILPGSRRGEITRLAAIFFAVALWLRKRLPEVQYVVPCSNQSNQALVESIKASVAPDLPITVIQGQSRKAMAAADSVLLASGTAAFEAMLLKRPMVVAYKLSALSYFILSRLVKLSQYSLPNLLVGRTVAPEYMQNDAVPEKIGPALEAALVSPDKSILADFDRVHKSLALNASEQAAAAVIELANV